MRFRLWAQIALTLTINLLLLGALGLALLFQQNSNMVDSFLYAPTRERIRDLGRTVEENFPEKAPAERTQWLASLEQPYGVTLAVYSSEGQLVAGPDLQAPATVLEAIRRDRRPNRQVEEDPAPPRKSARKGPIRPKGPPMFEVKQDSPSRYWVGYYFPLKLDPDLPPVRHALVVVAPSLFGSPLFFDWRPWVAGLALALLVTALCWFPLVRRVTSSIQTVRHASAEIAEGRFEVDIPVKGADEFADLASSIRRMSEQLSHLIHGQRRFLADVAHELCAPLSRIQLSTGILEQRAQASDMERVKRLERDVEHMSALVGDLLLFTKGTVKKPELRPHQLAGLVARVVEQEIASGSELEVSIDSSLYILADEEYFTRALANVLRNAIRYAGHAGLIRVKAEPKGTLIRMSVEDHGPGLAESDLEPIFSPFYRPDTARTPGTGGAGLGLAIVRDCMEACNGTVHCRNRKPTGLEVVMELRAEAAPAIS